MYQCLEPRVSRDMTVRTLSEQSAQRLCMRKCGARKVCLSTPPVDCQEIKSSGKRNDISEQEIKRKNN